MEVAARPSGHKRGLSAYDSQLAEFDPSGKAARPNEEEAAEGEAEPQEQPQEEQLPLTERAAFSLTALRAAQEAVIQQMDELQAAGLQSLDQMRTTFLERMAAAKQELALGLQNVEVSLRSNSAQALESRKRAETASKLVQQLGFRTNTDAPDLYSGEQEGEAAELPAAE